MFSSRTPDLIPDLPEELAWQCLLRVSFRSHSALQGVCRKWQDLLHSQEFYADRRRQGCSELRVCVPQVFTEAQDCVEKIPRYGISIYDPKANSWEILPTIPELPHGFPLFCQCVSTDNKLVLLGGWNPCNWEIMKCVYVFDFLTWKWEKRTEMLGIRCFFACGLLGDMVFVAGGHDDNKNALKTAEIYSLEDDKWQELPSMSQERDECKGVTLGDKFYAISGYTTDAQGQFLRSAEVFDRSTHRWSSVEDLWPMANCPASVFSFHGQLLSFQKHELLRYDFKYNTWITMELIPETLSDAVGAAAAVADSIFVCGARSNHMYFHAPANVSNAPGEWIVVRSGDQFNLLAQGACTIQI